MTTKLKVQMDLPPTRGEDRVLTLSDTTTLTSEFEIADSARAAYLAAFERIDDLSIALEIRAREQRSGEQTEITEFIREQGYDPAEFGL